MSIVGPRPLLPEYLALYSTVQNQRHDVKPGITGWAQVNGRNAITWEQKLDMDVWYTKNISFLLDMKIIIKTTTKFMTGIFTNSPDTDLPEKFRG
jgi:undecaprenyl phosphate N,N'-diacetylbacillosamine 1-phosphate transferase